MLDRTFLPEIKYINLDLNKIEVETREIRRSNKGRPAIERTLIDHKNGIRINPSKKFWSSFMDEFGLGNPSQKFFNYFDHSEIFQRVQKDMDTPMISVCLEHTRGQVDTYKAYGCTRDASHIPYDDVVGLIKKTDTNAKEIYFKDGLVHSVHRSKDPIANFTIGADDYDGFYEVITPVDGHGQPEVFIGTERLVCTNGMTIRNKAFRSEFKIGDMGMSTLAQIIDGFRNEDGYIQLKKRFENADLSYSSMREVYRTSRLLQEIVADGRNSAIAMSNMMYIFSEMLGDFETDLGISSLNQMSEKVAAGIPMRPTVLSLIQLLSEVSTHHVGAIHQGHIDKFIGSLISNNYDMELSKNHMGEYSQYLLDNRVK